MKIICVGRNYEEHARELNNPVPESPLLFMKPSTALLTDGKPFYHPDFSSTIHYELEIVLKICKNGKSIAPQFADGYFDQVGLGIDFTARDLQDTCKQKGHPWEIAKAFDHSAVVGAFVPRESLPGKEWGFQLKKNGEVVQNGNTRDLIFGFSELICHISRYFTLQTGDLVFTGTPAGVGKVEVGDELEGWLEGKKMLDCKIK